MCLFEPKYTYVFIYIYRHTYVCIWITYIYKLLYEITFGSCDLPAFPRRYHVFCSNVFNTHIHYVQDTPVPTHFMSYPGYLIYASFICFYITIFAVCLGTSISKLNIISVIFVIIIIIIIFIVIIINIINFNISYWYYHYRWCLTDNDNSDYLFYYQ